MGSTVKPPFRWFGSKTRLAPRLVSLLPEHDHYVEVFAGSAAVLFAKPRSRLETLNDIDREVVNLFSVLRDSLLTDRLLAAVELTPYARDEYAAAAWAPDLDPVEQARRFLVRTGQAVGNAGGIDGRSSSGWSYTITRSAVGASRSRRWELLPGRLAACADRLVGVQIDSIDWRDVLTKYDRPGVVMFVDPPYEHSTRPATTAAYAHEMTSADHDALVAALLDLRHAEAIVTHYPHETYDHLTASGWHVQDMASHADNATAKAQVERTERVWSSRPPPGTLF